MFENRRNKRSQHIEWTSPSGSIVLLGGIGSGADKTAEILPSIFLCTNVRSNQAHVNFAIISLAFTSMSEIWYWEVLRVSVMLMILLVNIVTIASSRWKNIQSGPQWKICMRDT